MNWSQFQTLFWLRYRLAYNYARRNGLASSIILMVFVGLGLAASVFGFLGALIAGALFLPDATSDQVILITDGWLGAFLFFWTIALLTELQQDNQLSLENLLHLPTSLREVFLFNFLATLISLTTVVLVPPFAGFLIGLSLAKGISALAALPVLAAFLFVVAALTCHFRSWLQSLMANKRRRRTVMTVVPIVFVFAAQAPYFAGMMFQAEMGQTVRPLHSVDLQRRDALLKKLQDQEITLDEFSRQSAEMEQSAVKQAQFEDGLWSQRLRMANLWLPIGWLALATQSAAEGDILPALLAVLVMTSVGGLSLRWAYRSTLREVIQGDDARRSHRKETVPGAWQRTDKRLSVGNRLERSLPFATEPIAVVAWAGWVSLIRSSEVKVMLLAPFIILLVSGVAISQASEGLRNVGDARSLLLIGSLWMTVLCMGQLPQNLFGFDRTGFRAYLLTGIPRHHLLIGRNLSLLPLVLLISLPTLALCQFFVTASWFHVIAILISLPTVFLMLCLTGNVVSTYFPYGLKPGTLQPVSINGVLILLQTLSIGLLSLVVTCLAAIPIVVELIAQYADLIDPRLPVSILLALLELAAMLAIYALLIPRQGDLLQERETQVLLAVATSAE